MNFISPRQRAVALDPEASMFGHLKGMKRLAETRNVVEDALMRSNPFPDRDASDRMATRLTAAVMAVRSDLYNGKGDKRPPHVVAGAAFALAAGMQDTSGEFDDEAKRRMALALGSLLISASGNSATYGFGGYDVPLLKASEKAYWEHEERTRAETDRWVGSLGL